MAYRNFNAKRNYGKRYYPKKNFGRKRTRKYTEVEKLAYRMGQVKKGLQNPDSLVCASYERGLNSQAKPRKALF